MMLCGEDASKRARQAASASANEGRDASNGAGANERERGVVGRGGKSAVAKEETPGERTGVGRDGRSGEGLGRT